MVRLSQRFMAWLLSKGEKIEKEMYGREKKSLFKIKSSSIVLEIGPGTGINLQYYPKKIRWIGIEPNPEMNKHIKIKAKEQGFNIKLINGNAEKIPIKDNLVDYVVSTLVLCSVENPSKVLKEIKRVLKSRGKFLFIEHVADKKGTLRCSLQNITPHTPWKFFSDGCHPNREIWKIIGNEFRKVKIKKYYRKGNGLLSYLINPHIIGQATK